MLFWKEHNARARATMHYFGRCATGEGLVALSQIQLNRCLSIFLSQRCQSRARKPSPRFKSLRQSQRWLARLSALWSCLSSR